MYMMNFLKPAYLLRKSVHYVVHRLQSRNIDRKDIKSNYPAIILSIFFKVTFSGFDYLLPLVLIQHVGKHLRVSMRKIFDLAEHKHVVLFRDYVNLPASGTEISFYYMVSEIL